MKDNTFNIILSFTNSNLNHTQGKKFKINNIKTYPKFEEKNHLPHLNKITKKQDRPIEDLNEEYSNLKIVPIIKADHNNKSSSLIFNKSPNCYPMLKDLTTINKSKLSKPLLLKLNRKNYHNEISSEPTSAEEKSFVNKIDILYQCEKASVVIQKLWRGWRVRYRLRKYKAKYLNKHSNKLIHLPNVDNNSNPRFSLSPRSDVSNISINTQELDYSSEDSDDNITYSDDF